VKLIDKWIKSEAAQWTAAYAIAAFMWVLFLTVRWRRHMPAETRDLIDAGKPVIFCLWHGRMLLFAGAQPRPPKRIGVLASPHRDGRLIGNCAVALGYDAVFGSSSKRGVSALRGVAKLIEDGVPMAITPDGPRGPRMRLKPGALKIAQMTGAAMVAFTGSARPRKVFGSWDRFCLPLPFARAELHFGPPVYLPREADADTLERCRRALEDSLNALTNVAERSLGQEEIRAAAPGEHRKDAAGSHAGA